MNRAKLYHRLRLISLYGMSKTIPMFTQLVLSVVIVRMSSVEFWGEYIQILIPLNVIMIFLNFGNTDFLLKEFSLNPSKIRENWIQNITARAVILVCASVILCFIPLFVAFRVPVLLWLTFQFVINSFHVLVLFFRSFQFSLYVELFYGLVIVTGIMLTDQFLSLNLLLLWIAAISGIKVLVYGIYFKRMFVGFRFYLNLYTIQKSIPFLIPIAVGTFMNKIDIYYSSYFFNSKELGEYHIFSSILLIYQLFIGFLITPFLKNLYRIRKRKKIYLNQSILVFSIVSSFVFIIVSYFFFIKFYRLNFESSYYTMGILYMLPQLTYAVIVNHFYKNNLQKTIAIIVSVVMVFQLLEGYILINEIAFMGALIVKVTGTWLVVLTLVLYDRYKHNDTVFSSIS